MTLAAALVEAVSKITGYVGEEVVLRSGAAQSEVLHTIEWSILSNNTAIAIFSSDHKEVDLHHQFSGRLFLNVSSGKNHKLIYCLKMDST